MCIPGRRAVDLEDRAAERRIPKMKTTRLLNIVASWLNPSGSWNTSTSRRLRPQVDGGPGVLKHYNTGRRNYDVPDLFRAAPRNYGCLIAPPT